MSAQVKSLFFQYACNLGLGRPELISSVTPTGIKLVCEEEVVVLLLARCPRLYCCPISARSLLDNLHYLLDALHQLLILGGAGQVWLRIQPVPAQVPHWRAVRTFSHLGADFIGRPIEGPDVYLPVPDPVYTLPPSVEASYAFRTSFLTPYPPASPFSSSHLPLPRAFLMITSFTTPLSPAHIRAYFLTQLPAEELPGIFFEVAGQSLLHSLATYFSGSAARPACTLENIVAAVRYPHIHHVLAMLATDQESANWILHLQAALAGQAVLQVAGVTTFIDLILEHVSPAREAQERVHSFISAYAA